MQIRLDIWSESYEYNMNSAFVLMPPYWAVGLEFSALQWKTIQTRMIFLSISIVLVQRKNQFHFHCLPKQLMTIIHPWILHITYMQYVCAIFTLDSIQIVFFLLIGANNGSVIILSPHFIRYVHPFVFTYPAYFKWPSSIKTLRCWQLCKDWDDWCSRFHHYRWVRVHIGCKYKRKPRKFIKYTEVSKLRKISRLPFRPSRTHICVSFDWF